MEMRSTSLTMLVHFRVIDLILSLLLTLIAFDCVILLRPEYHDQVFFAQFSGINRVKGRASLWLTIASTCRQFYCAVV